MDTVTQALLGATVGQVGFRHRLGRRALGWGAAAGVLPDLDVIVAQMNGPFGELVYHRGVSHALWFGPAVGPILGFALWRATRPQPASAEDDRALLRAWIGLFVLALFTHPLLDLFTVYGTQLLAPFSSHRFALNGVGIIDPFYSVLLIAALVAGGVWRRRPDRVRTSAAIALAASTAYLFFGLYLNKAAEADIRRVLAVEGHAHARVRVYPTILQPFLRRVVARTGNEVRVGHYTPFRPGRPQWETFAQESHPLVHSLRETPEGSLFEWFAMGEINPRVRSSQEGTVVEIDDLRYGLPGHPREGLWGIRAVFDADGRLRGPVVRFARDRLGRAPTLTEFWRAMWGDLSTLSLARPVPR